MEILRASSVPKRQWQSFAAFGLLAVLALYFRLPVFLSGADILGSDYIFPALQARQILQGHWSLFLWGSEYQASVEPTLIAGLFALFGSSQTVFLAFGLACHLATLGVAFLCLRPYLSPLLAALVLLPTTIMTPLLLPLTFFAPRPGGFLLMAVTLLSLARLGRRSAWVFWIGGFVPFFLLFLDFYFIQFVPSLLCFAFLSAKDGEGELPRPRLRMLKWGALWGIVSLLATRPFAAGPAPLSFTPATLFGRGRLHLLQECLAYLSGGEVNSGVLSPTQAFLACTAGFAFLAFCLWGGWGGWRNKSLPGEVRRFAFFGGSSVLVCLIGFVGSQMACDKGSTRYLFPILFSSPFALLPLLVGRFRSIVVPTLIAFVSLVWIATWIEYAPQGAGLIPRRMPSLVKEQGAQLERFLSAKGVRYAEADYWKAYHLTWLLEERLIVVPRTARDDRYKGYRMGFRNAPVRAHLFHFSEPPHYARSKEDLLLRDNAFGGKYSVGEYTVLLERPSVPTSASN